MGAVFVLVVVFPHVILSSYPVFHTVLFILFGHVSVLFLVRLTCASGHMHPGGRVPAVLVCFPGVGLRPSEELAGLASLK